MKTQHKRTVLVLDDDEVNLMILTKNAQEAGYHVKSFTMGETAYEYMMHNPQEIDIAVLDKMMPGLNGLELLKRIKNMDSMRHMPVILQTGDVGVEQMREGLESGAYYYLTKPFHPEILTAILHSAAHECTMRKELIAQMTAGHAQFIGLLREGEFIFKTHAEARLLAATLSQAAHYPEFVALGLMELFANAIEHGNLNIGYHKKRKCLLSNTWVEELATRSGSAEYANRVVHVRTEKTQNGMHVSVRDEGKGFDWEQCMYSEDMPNQFNEPNGRGIAKAMIMLDDMRYAHKGNEVHCNISLSAGLAVTGERTPFINSMYS